MLATSIFIESQRSKVYFNEMQALAESLQVGLARTGKEPLVAENLITLARQQPLTCSNVDGA